MTEKISDVRLAVLAQYCIERESAERRWVAACHPGRVPTIANLLAELVSALAELAEFRERDKRKVEIVINETRCMACGLPNHQCPNGGRLLR